MEQNALYYPQIGFHDPSWIKSMSLFYDNIYRIVPDNVIPNDSEELRALLEEGSVGRMINPANYSSRASQEFLDNLPGWDAAALMGDDGEEEQLSRIHFDKTDERVRALFKDAGYQEDNEWMHVPTKLASNFMFYLASLIANNNRLSLITGDWGAWTGTTYFGVDGKVDNFLTNIGHTEDDFADSFGLFGLILSKLAPINIAEIPSEKILEFRRKRKDEITNFRNAMNELRAEISQLEDVEIRKDVIKRKAYSLIKAQEEYKSSADLLRVKGWFGVSLMGFPAPLVLGKLFSIPAASTISLAASGLAIGVLFNINNTKEELRKLNQTHPASFISQLRHSFKDYTRARGGGDMNFHAYNCMEEYIND